MLSFAKETWSLTILILSPNLAYSAAAKPSPFAAIIGTKKSLPSSFLPLEKFDCCQPFNEIRKDVVTLSVSSKSL